MKSRATREFRMGSLIAIIRRRKEDRLLCAAGTSKNQGFDQLAGFIRGLNEERLRLNSPRLTRSAVWCARRSEFDKPRSIELKKGSENK